MGAHKGLRCCLSLFAVVLFALLGCGGGGDSGDAGGGGGQDPPTVPEVLNYSVSQQWFEDPDLLSAGVSSQTFTLTAISMTGTYNRTTRAATLASSSSLGFSVAPYGEMEQLDVFVLIPDEGGPVQWVGQQDPTAGALQINIPPGLFDFDRLHVAVDGLSGVGITAFDGPDEIAGAASTLTWQEFDAVDENETATVYQKIARLSYSVWRFAFAHVDLAYLGLATTVTNDAALERDKTYTADGEIFPGTNAAGTLRIDWVDATGNGDLGPGDAFNATFTQWWADDPSDDIDDLYEGLLAMTGYTETETSVGADFKFAGFSERETENDLTILPEVTTVNGGFNLTYSW